MKHLKNYDNLYQLYRKSTKKIRILIYVFLAIFILAFITLFFDFIPFDVTMVMMLSIIPAIIFGFVLPIAYFRTAKLFKVFTPEQIEQIDAQLFAAESYGTIYVTAKAIVDTRAGLYLLPTEDALWVYMVATDLFYRQHFFKIATNTQLVVADRNGKKRYLVLNGGEECYQFIQKEMLKYRQNIVFGNEFGLDEIYENDRPRMIAFAEEEAEKYRAQM